ncbi:MAG: MFS transporter [Verrucomicrobiales bacterium]
MNDSGNATRSGKTALWSWCFYDWASQAFATVVQTFVFAAYFTNRIASDPESGTTQWSLTIGLTGLAVAATGPFFGAIADRTGRRKPWLAAFALLCAVATACLWYVQPRPEDVVLALGLLAVAVFGIESAGVFYNAMLGDLASPREYGRWSGRGWGLGYVGGICCLVAVLFLFGGEGESVGPNVGSVRATYPFVGAWIVAFTLPLLLLAPDRGGSGEPWRDSVVEGLGQLRETLKTLPRHRGLLRFLIARAIYTDGLATLFALAGVYAAGTFGMEGSEILVFGIALNISAGLGSVLFSRIDDRVGSRRTILASLAGLFCFVVLALAAPSEFWFWTFGLLLGLFVGPVQSSSRSYLSHLAPESLRAQMFGLYALASKATSFSGPLLVGGITALAGSQRIGLAVIPVYFAVGWLVLRKVPEAKGPS